jgi:hypothetical protein
MNPPACIADCFQDGAEVRPVKAPNALVWTYFNVLGEGPGSLEARRFSACPCGCGKLVADPASSKDGGPSFTPKPAVAPKPPGEVERLRQALSIARSALSAARGAIEDQQAMPDPGPVVAIDEALHEILKLVNPS